MQKFVVPVRISSNGPCKPCCEEGGRCGSLQFGTMIRIPAFGPRMYLAFLTIVLVFLAFVPRSAPVHAHERPDGPALFAGSGCVHCHGSTGEGTKRGPALTGVRDRMTAGQIHDQIKNGGKEMPAFADSLSDEQIDALVKMVRGKHWPALPPSSER